MSNPYQSPETNSRLGAGASAAQPPAMTPDFQDQSTGLTLFGVFQILIGCVCAFMALGVVVSVMAPMPGAIQDRSLNARLMIPGIITYLELAVAFIWLGAGSILARRWARALIVILSWLWLTMGVAAMIAMVVMLPAMGASMQQQGKIPPQMVVVTQVIIVAVLAGIYVLLPVLFLLFYQRASVRATCQWRDPQTRWTDRCPAPVLALSVVLAYSAMSMPTSAVYGCVAPFFGVLISGAAGAAVLLLTTLLSALLCWGTYRLKMAAWWGALLLGIAGTVSTALTFSRVGSMEMYEKMGLSGSQLEMIQKTGAAEWVSMARGVSIMAGIVLLGYLLYVRRYFVRREGR
jgi:hypothetical protein